MTQALGEVRNGIGEAGARALARALATNTNCVALDVTGFNDASSATREQIRVALRRNFRNLDAAGKTAAHAVLFPPHLAEVASVYRLGGEYRGDPEANASVWEASEEDERGQGADGRLAEAEEDEEGEGHDGEGQAPPMPRRQFSRSEADL